LSKKIPAGIAPVALKEPSEPAVVAEVSAMTTHLNFGLANGVALDKTVSDAFIKGMGDKRVPVKRLWAIRAADIWWGLSDAQQAQPDVLAFCQTTLPKLIEIWQEVNANPLPATQTGLVTAGHYATAILIDRVQSIKDEKLGSIYKKSDVISQSLATQPKPSFLLNPKVYSKLSSEEDVSIALRALNAIAPDVTQASKEVADAWAQAFIFLIVAPSVSAKAKSAAKQALTATYLQTSPEKISNIIIEGLWSWYRSSELEDKDSAAFASKAGPGELGAVLSCICLPSETIKKHEASVDATSLQKQAMNLVVLARKEIIPRVSWIDLCLRMGVDPGQIVRENLQDFVSTINEATEVLHHLHSTKQPIANTRYRTRIMSDCRQSARRPTVLILTWLSWLQRLPYQPSSSSLVRISTQSRWNP
jgi:hypothetical protein